MRLDWSRLGILIWPAVLAPMTPLEAAEGVGEAKAVIDRANASGSIGERVLAVGSLIYLGERVQTDAAGEAQLRFKDGTRMVVGPNSSLVIDEFLFRSDAPANSFAVRALGGSFRFISGAAGDNGYAIRTPTATIGVRGTAFDLAVEPKLTRIVLIEGAAQICDTEGSCAALSRSCELGEAGRRRPAEVIEDEAERRDGIRRSFPYLMTQSSLLAEFRLGAQGCRVAAAAAPDAHGAPAIAAASPPPAAEPPPAPEPAPPPAAEPPLGPAPAPPPAADPPPAAEPPPATEPPPGPEPAPPPDTGGRPNNGHGNGSEPGEADTPDGSDPSNPGGGSGAGGPGTSRGNNGHGNGTEPDDPPSVDGSDPSNPGRGSGAAPPGSGKGGRGHGRGGGNSGQGRGNRG